MMLVTLACTPPSWLAMLPQKFSAATTAILVVDPLDELVFCAGVEVEQPAPAVARPVPGTRARARRIRSPDSCMVISERSPQTGRDTPSAWLRPSVGVSNARLI